MKNDSLTFRVWKMFMNTLVMFVGLSIIHAYGTSWASIITDEHNNKNVSFKPKIIISTFLIIEILLNFLTEHTIDED